MKSGLVIYHSKTGITKALGWEINEFLENNNIKSRLISLTEFNESDLQNADYVFLGCWTSGLMVLLQHPEQIWIDFMKKLPDLKGKKISLFTTYKIATGSMFRNMKRHVKCDPSDISLELKSRDGHLSEAHLRLLREFIK